MHPRRDSPDSTLVFSRETEPRFSSPQALHFCRLRVDSRLCLSSMPQPTREALNAFWRARSRCDVVRGENAEVFTRGSGR